MPGTEWRCEVKQTELLLGPVSIHMQVQLSNWEGTLLFIDSQSSFFVLIT